MPHPAWKHYCTKLDREVISGSSTCDSCGGIGQYDGWYFGQIEAMGAYQRRTGLKPIGKHRPLADMILSPLLSACERCAGRGLVCDGDDEWSRCQRCDGMMYVRNVSESEFEATRCRILREFPEAGVTAKASSRWRKG